MVGSGSAEEGALARESIDQNELWWLRHGPGAHGPDRSTASDVEESLHGCFRFKELTDLSPGLRSPQLGALHAILASRSMETPEAITIVMPTGTGKTETMLATFCHSPRRTLVIVPSDALRTQIAKKFATLGVLPEAGAVEGEFLCPVVLLLKSGLDSAAQMVDLVGHANIVVATTQAIENCADDARLKLVDMCDRLFVDEAHHVAARTWRAVSDLFSEKEVVQFTATPYREDGKHLGGRIAYAYPLRLAKKNGLFAKINYRSVIDLVNPDRSVAEAAIAQLRDDLSDGLDHVLMARVSSVERARRVVRLYEELAPELAPIRIDRTVAESTRTKRLAALSSRRSRIVVCVNMLGEGFDLPALKVAAIHDPQKSLAVTLQFVGRFTRASGDQIGDASAFVPLQVAGVDDRLRSLYGEDADWNVVVEDLTDHAAAREKERSEFENQFGSLPREIAMRSIHPKMSTVTYQSDSPDWRPEQIYELFADRLLTTQLGVNNNDKVVWWVSREETPVRWGDFASFNELVHHLHVVHVDEAPGFLYINSTNNASLHEDIAEAVGGAGMRLLSGEIVYRVLDAVTRRVPTNVGLLDAVSRNRRFSMHVGQDVLAAWRGEGGTKMKTNIFAHGFANGRAVSFGASRKGRVWTHEEARDIHDWVGWVRKIGPILTDESIILESVMEGFLLPEPAKERPSFVPLAIEWPHSLVATMSENRRLAFHDESFPLIDCELRLLAHESDGPLAFEVVTPGWTLPYEFRFRDDEPPEIVAIGDDGIASTARVDVSIASFLTSHGLLVTFEDELTLTEQGFLLKPDRERRLFPVDAIEAANWDGINLKRESQGANRDPGTIQYRTIENLVTEAEWEIVLDDDGSGELADVVLMRRDGEDLVVLFAHCKYSSKPTPGARIDDLYDVCGQAMKMNRAKSLPDMFTKKLLRRESNRQKDGRSGLIVGTIEELRSVAADARYLKLDASIAIVQPGMSKAKASDDMRALLGGVDRFLDDTFGMKLRVVGSE